MEVVADGTYKIINIALEVHKILGPGLLESTYEECFAHEMKIQGLQFFRQLAVPTIYKNIRIENSYRMDFLVENSVVIELKAIDKILPVHEAQILTYMKLSQKKIGLLINFNVGLLKEGGIRRFVF